MDWHNFDGNVGYSQHRQEIYRPNSPAVIRSTGLVVEKKKGWESIFSGRTITVD